jgi:Domain of unknown function (DUF4260)
MKATMISHEASAGPLGFSRILRAEGLAVFALTVFAYWTLGGMWQLFALLFLAPDLGMLPYLAGPRFGAFGYNATHSEIGPILLGIYAIASHSAVGAFIALIWGAHIGFDRALGYGLKSPAGFRCTHLGMIGRGSD